SIRSERLSVLPGQKLVRLRVLEALLGGRERELAPEEVPRLLELYPVRHQVLFHAAQRLAGRLVVAESPRDLPEDLVERLRLPEAIGNVGQVAQGAREMALENVRSQVLALPAPHAVDEILEVVSAALAGRDRLWLVRVFPVNAAAHDERALGAVK